MKKCMNHISYEKLRQTDIMLKEALEAACENVEASDDLKRRIDNEILMENKKEEYHMKHFSMKKVVIGVAAACLIVGTVGVAASGIGGYISYGSVNPDYTDFQSMAKVEEEVGYEVDAVESFSNGYKLKDVHVGETTMQNTDGTSAGPQKDIRIDYRRGEEQIFFMARKLFTGETEDFGSVPQKTLQCGDVTVRFSQTTYKSVPPDYEPTEEDKKREAAGILMIGYGSTEVEVSEHYYAGWVKEGILYSISGFDLSLNADEILNMAKEIIEKGI